VAAALAVAGCGGSSDKQQGTSGQASGSTGTQTGEDAKVQDNLAKLSAEDRQLAEAQRTCPVSGEPLGGMGTPVKVTLDGQAVFLCCRSCDREAREDPGKTLARVKELRAKAPAR
jgi:hypothetical protein